MPKITIITVVLNDEKHIEQTILSVLNQTFTDYEYWVIDGQSTDGTLDIVRKYSDRLRFVSEKDRGLYDAMNKGLNLATGEYVLFLNSGDRLYDSHVLEKIFNLPPADVYYGDVSIVDEQGNVKGLRRLRPPENLTWKSFAKGMLVAHQAFIPRRELCPPYDLKYRFSADYDWTIKILRKAKVVINTGLIIVEYLDGGLTKKNLLKSLRERFRIMSKNYGFLPTVLRHIGFAFRLAYFYVKNRWF